MLHLCVLPSCLYLARDQGKLDTDFGPASSGRHVPVSLITVSLGEDKGVTAQEMPKVTLSDFNVWPSTPNGYTRTFQEYE